MKAIFDLFGVLLFFGTYWYTRNIYTATLVAMGATVAQVLYTLVRYRTVDKLQWLGLALIIIFGGATLVFRDAHFIMWKPTVLYSIIGISLFFSERLLGRNGIRVLLDGQLTLPDRVWTQLCSAWSGFFLVLALLNLIVAYHFSEAVWVNFKLFGGLGLTVLFVILQGFFVLRHIREK